jgi:hypothetical protein
MLGSWCTLEAAIVARGLCIGAVSGVGVGCSSFKMATCGQWPLLKVRFLENLHATDRFGAASVYLVLFG